MTDQITAVADGRLVYREFMDEGGLYHHLIRFPLLTHELHDEYGNPRLDATRLVRNGQWLESNALNWLMQGLGTVCVWQFEAFFWIRTGVPYLGREGSITTYATKFLPSQTRNTIIIRLVNHNRNHWVAIAHFHALNTLVFFDSFGTPDGDGSVAGSALNVCLESQRRFVLGSQAAPKEGEELLVIAQRGKLQYDNWACGLWCMGFVRTIVQLLSERRALDGEEVNYAQLLNTLREEMDQNRIARLSLEEAHRLARTAWVSQAAPEHYL